MSQLRKLFRYGSRRISQYSLVSSVVTFEKQPFRLTQTCAMIQRMRCTISWDFKASGHVIEWCNRVFGRTC